MIQPKRTIRTLMVVLGGLVAALAFPLSHMMGSEIEVPLTWRLHGLCLLMAIPLSFRTHLGSQMLARAVWWQTLFLLFLVCLGPVLYDSLQNPWRSWELLTPWRFWDFLGSIPNVAVFMSVGSLTALVGAGRVGLNEGEEDNSQFQPIAFRTPLMMALTLALADTVTLFLHAGLGFEKKAPWINSPCLLLMAGFAMLVGLHGMYRLKLWGLVLNMVTNLVVAGLVLTDMIDIGMPVLNGALVATALAQLLIPLPMLRRIVANICNSEAQDGAVRADGLYVEPRR